MNEPGIWIALGATLVGVFFAATGNALRVFSRSKLTDYLESVGRTKNLDAFFNRVPEMVLMTGALRLLCTMVVLLAVFDTVNKRMPEESHALLVYLLVIALAGLLVSVFMVAVAGSWARYSPEKLLARSMPVLNITLILFVPLVRFLRIFDPVVRRLVGADNESKEKEVSDQVMEVVEEAEDEGHVDEVQKEMIEAVFEFPKTTAGEIMTPRTDVEGIEVSSDLEKVKQTILRDSHSRIPVYEETVDRIVGVLYIKDLTQYIGDSANNFELRSLMREPMMVPESKPLGKLLSEFKINKVHIAIVLDEYGGTAGLVTIEDVIEELVGEIEDEYEEEQDRPTITRADELTADVDARVEIDDANDQLGLNLPEDEDYETIGGFVFSTLGHIPTVGESIELEKARLIVTEAEQNRVKRLRVEFASPVPVEDRGNGRNGK